MIAADTNVLARFYCDDPQDPEAARQRPIARRVMVESPSLSRSSVGKPCIKRSRSTNADWSSPMRCTGRAVAVASDW